MDRSVWRQSVLEPIERGDIAAAAALLAALRPASGGVMWRTGKASVAAELGLREQHAHVSRLTLGAVERHFYNRCHAECATRARELLPASVVAAVSHAGSLDAASDRELTAREADALHAPLLRLRKACCHPQVRY